VIITIDGAAGTGKSTVAKKVAEQLGFSYFDTGAMYRAFAFFVDSHEADIHHEEIISELVKSFKFDFQGEGTKKIYFVNGQDVTAAIRTPKISEVSSIISQYPLVRKALHQVQKDFAANRNAVFEGRDLGTVIFPNADFKFFLKASDEVRAQRRFDELNAKNIHTSYQEVLKAIQERDHRDEKRKVAPLKCAEDAFVVDTSFLSVEQVVEQIIKVVGNKK
jgi:cytidylate kinase